MEAILNETAEFLETTDAILDILKKIKTTIPRSKSLAADILEFCKEIERLPTLNPAGISNEAHALLEKLQNLEKENERLQNKLYNSEQELTYIENAASENIENLTRFIRDILDNEPDATLRKKPERLVDAILIRRADISDLNILV